MTEDMNDQMEAMQIGARAAETAARSTPVETDSNAPRQFLAPQQPNSKFLVRRGKPRVNSLVNTSSGIENLSERVGDVWVRFQSGIFSLFAGDEDYQIKLDWLVGHSGDPEVHRIYHETVGENASSCSVPYGLCREGTEDGIEDWVEMKSGQIDTMYQDHTVRREMDVDAYFARGRDNARHLTSGLGAELAAAIEANRNAAKQRAQGKG